MDKRSLLIAVLMLLVVSLFAAGIYFWLAMGEPLMLIGDLAGAVASVPLAFGALWLVRRLDWRRKLPRPPAKKVQTEPAAIAPAPALPKLATVTVVTGTRAPNPTDRLCVRCGQPAKKFADFCTKCGLSLTKHAFRCECGAVHQDLAPHCNACGAKLDLRGLGAAA